MQQNLSVIDLFYVNDCGLCYIENFTRAFDLNGFHEYLPDITIMDMDILWFFIRGLEYLEIT